MGTRRANRRKAEKRDDSRLAVVTVILESEVAKERDRAAELEQYRIYVQSKAFMEKTAKEKLGLVNPGEIILEPEQ